MNAAHMADPDSPASRVCTRVSFAARLGLPHAGGAIA